MINNDRNRPEFARLYDPPRVRTAADKRSREAVLRKVGLKPRRASDFRKD
jgi:hypothetical protein